MKWRGPGASLNPTAEAARAAARVHTRMPSGPQASSVAGVAIGDWWLTTDEHGALVADHIPSSTRRVIALPPGPMGGTENPDGTTPSERRR